MNLLKSIEKNLPGACMICSQVVPLGELFCSKCTPYAMRSKSVCPKCSLYYPDALKYDVCSECEKSVFSSLYSPFVYAGSVAVAVKNMKYAPNIGYARRFGMWLSYHIPYGILKQDLILFPPMTLRDKFRRSFNQSEIVAETLSLRLKIPLGRSVVKKIRQTEKQADLSFEMRAKNLKKAFVLKKPVSGLRILIVDDVATTLATVSVLSKLLKSNGAASVNVVTIARKSRFFR